MTEINRGILDQLSEIIRPFATTQSDREALIVRAFGVGATTNRIAGSIEINGTTSNFTILLIRRLVDYGEDEPGKPTLRVLLESIRHDVGPDRQAEIDELIAALYGNREALTVTPETPNAPPSGEHVFVSYSRADKERVMDIIPALERAGIRIWVDQSGLTPGTPDWEQALRDAIQGSKAVILAASPDSRRSVFVKDELRIAQMYGRPLYPIWVSGSEWIDSIPMGLGGVQFVDARGDDYASAVTSLAALLRTGETESVTHGDVSPPDDAIDGPTPLPQDSEKRNPYQGLRAFTEKDTRYFFGRDALVTEFVEKLFAGDARFLAVVGPSGGGKSSLVMAGMIPALSAANPEWRFLEPMVPGSHPLESLASALSTELPAIPLPNIVEAFEKDNAVRSLHQFALSISKPPQQTVLYVDQFEELFTLTETEVERQRFIDLLTTAVSESSGTLTVILSLRADFMDRPLAYAELAQLLDNHNVLIRPMDVSDLRDIIIKPAQLQGLTFEGDLVGDLLFEVRGESGALPLLEFTLEQLYEKRDGNTLTRAAYNEIGGVRGALANHAETTYQQLPTEQHKQLARALFLRLIEPGATEQDTTRRRVPRTDLRFDDAKVTDTMGDVVDTFTTARLLVAGENTLEVAHEALIREWETLGAWLRDARDDLRLQKIINSSAAEWVRQGRSDTYDGLYRGKQLEAARGWMARNTPTADEQGFIQTSVVAEQAALAREAQQQRNLRIARAAAIAVLLVALVGGLLGTLLALNNIGNQRDAAIRSAEEAQSITWAIQAEEAYEDNNQPLAYGLALNANRIANPPGIAQDTFAKAILAPGTIRQLPRMRHSGEVLSVAYSPDGRTVVSGSSDTTLIVWDVDSGQALRTLSGHFDRVLSVAYSPDGRTVVSGSSDTTLIVWDVDSGQALRTLSGHSGE
ncbi:MAG: TIR domain-containing protein, partial [Chloroflexota bacterium]